MYTYTHQKQTSTATGKSNIILQMEYLSIVKNIQMVIFTRDDLCKVFSM